MDVGSRYGFSVAPGIQVVEERLEPEFGIARAAGPHLELREPVLEVRARCAQPLDLREGGVRSLEVAELELEQVRVGLPDDGIGRGRAHCLSEQRPRTLEILRATPDGWLIVAVYRGDVRVRAEPFDAIELDLAVVWAALAPRSRGTRASEDAAEYEGETASMP